MKALTFKNIGIHFLTYSTSAAMAFLIIIGLSQFLNSPIPIILLLFLPGLSYGLVQFYFSKSLTSQNRIWLFSKSTILAIIANAASVAMIIYFILENQNSYSNFEYYHLCAGTTAGFILSLIPNFILNSFRVHLLHLIIPVVAGVLLQIASAFLTTNYYFFGLVLWLGILGTLCSVQTHFICLKRL